ncbi:helix-turn-helix transcriptional regulator [Gracilibacillus alcaliphilus]|uniref:helix-turn-helix transcriptional regulator n=1 Tax=Gracilibacillus alcaliphilus TaxID=1401441 RepID=UPI00195D2CD8|nr:YafY family protein [Gracilibacillus alcaliphilus]MBM7679319.1 putative DNA-binding transcriptional regulator YafY [Gracilibacillus alcaliphilus]
MISILLLVESRGSIKAKELAEDLEISVRTIYRDINILCEAGIPLRTTTGPKGGIQLMDGYSTGLKNLHADDFIHLYLSGIGIQPIQESNMSVQLNNALLKLKKNVPEELVNTFDTIRNRFYFDGSPWWGNNTQLSNIDILLLSVFKSNMLTITYQKVNGSSFVRKIYPYGIVVKQIDWYLVAYCDSSKEIRTFKCERIVKAEILNDNFNISDRFSLIDYWDRSKQHFFQKCADNEQYPVQIKIQKKHVQLLSGFEVIRMDEEGTELTITANLYSYDHALKVILEKVVYIEVIQPIELRVAIERTLNEMLQKYREFQP